VRAELDELIAWVAAAEEQGSLAADPAAYLRAMGGARALVDQAAAAGAAQPLLERPGREALCSPPVFPVRRTCGRAAVAREAGISAVVSGRSAAW
jgi:hypothetical protein